MFAIAATLLVVAFLAFPTRLVAGALYCGIAVYLIVPLREVGRLLFRHT